MFATSRIASLLLLMLLLLPLSSSTTATATTTVRPPVSDVGTEPGDDAGGGGGYESDDDSNHGTGRGATSSWSWTSSSVMDALDRFLSLNNLLSPSWTRDGGDDVSAADVPPAGVSDDDGGVTRDGDGGDASGATEETEVETEGEATAAEGEALDPPPRESSSSSSSVSPHSARVTTAPTTPEEPSNGGGGGNGGGVVSSWIRTLGRGLKSSLSSRHASRPRRGDDDAAVGEEDEGGGSGRVVADVEGEEAGETLSRPREGEARTQVEVEVEVEVEGSTVDGGVGGGASGDDSPSDAAPASGRAATTRSSDRVHVVIVLPPPLYTRVSTTTTEERSCRVVEDRNGGGGGGGGGGGEGEGKGQDGDANSCRVVDDVDSMTRSHFYLSHACASLLALASELAYAATAADVLPGVAELERMEDGGKGDRLPPVVTVLATYEVGQREETMRAIRRELSLPPESQSPTAGGETSRDKNDDDDDVRIRILSSPLDLGPPNPLDSAHSIEKVRRAEAVGFTMTPFISDVRRYADRRLLPAALPMHRSLRGMMDELAQSGGGNGRGAPDVLVVDSGTLGGVLLAEQLRVPTVLLASPTLLPLVAPPGAAVGSGSGLWCISSSSGVDGDRGGRCVGSGGSDSGLPPNASAATAAEADGAAANRSSSSPSLPPRRLLPSPGTGFVRSRMGLFSRVRNVLHERFLAFVLSFTLVGINKIRWELGLASWKSLESYFHVASDIIVDTAIGFEYDRPLPCHVHLTGPLLPHRRRGDRGINTPLPPLSSESADPTTNYSHATAKKEFRSGFIPEDVLLGYESSPGRDTRDEEWGDNSTVNIVVNNLEMSTSELRHVVRGLVFARTALRSYANEVCSLTDDVCSRHDVNCNAGNLAYVLRRECKELDALATFHVAWVAETAAIGRTILPPVLPSFLRVVGLDEIRGDGSMYEVFHAAASLSHCSHSNVLSALADGVPCLCTPSTANDMDVAARIIDADCGLVIPRDGIHAAGIRDGIVGLLIGNSKKVPPRQVLDDLLLDIHRGVSNFAAENNLDSCRRRGFFLNHTYTCSAQSARLDLRMAGGTSLAANVVMHAAKVGAFEDSSRLFGRSGGTIRIHHGLRHEQPLHLPCGWDAFVVAVAVSILCVTSMVLAWDLMRSSTFKRMISFRDDIRRILSRG